MTSFNMVMLIAFSAVSVSYGWGMRGTIIGGEKGAMLPGAFLGLAIALFSGSEALAENPFLLAGVGALAMFCGGNMTYADTLDFSMKTRPAPELKKGMIALLIKGGIWFGLFGGYVSMFISVLSGFYSVLSLVIFFVCLPIAALICFKIFNTPFDYDKKIFPKFYFSVFRKETWGGLLGMLLEIVIFTAVMRDWSSLAMTLGTFVSGSLGWVIAQGFQIISKHPSKKGIRLFDIAYRNGLIDTWKIMECTFGALGGIGTAATFILSRGLFAEKLADIDANGFHEIIPGNISKILICVYGAVLVLDAVQYYIKENESKFAETYRRVCEKSEFAVYSTIPMILCFFGCYNVAFVAAFMLVMHVLCLEFIEKRFLTGRKAIIPKTAVFIIMALVFILQAVIERPVSLMTAILLYTFFYEAMYYIIFKLPNKEKLLSGSERTVHGYFIICCLVIIILILAL